MPRTCSVCSHPSRDEIDRALVAGSSLRDIAGQFTVSRSALDRHKTEHLPVSLANAVVAAGEARDMDTLTELRQFRARVEKLYNACDAWLTDPDNPESYTLTPRAEDVKVIYLTPTEDGELVRRSERLSVLLRRVEGLQNVSVVLLTETKYADPRELILKTAQRLEGYLTLSARLIGELDDRAHVNIVVTDTDEWRALLGTLLDTLRPYPDAALAVADRLEAVEAGA